MPYIGPIIIMLLVLSAVLIPLMITVWHTAARSTKRTDPSRTATRRQPTDEATRAHVLATNNVVRLADRRRTAH